MKCIDTIWLTRLHQPWHQDYNWDRNNWLGHKTYFSNKKKKCAWWNDILWQKWVKREQNVSGRGGGVKGIYKFRVHLDDFRVWKCMKRAHGGAWYFPLCLLPLETKKKRPPKYEKIALPKKCHLLNKRHFSNHNNSPIWTSFQEMPIWNDQSRTKWCAAAPFLQNYVSEGLRQFNKWSKRNNIQLQKKCSLIFLFFY